MEEYKMSKEQELLVDAVSSAYVANKLMGKQLNEMYINYHYQACNGAPGWNVFLNNMRFELGNKTRVRLSLPITNEDEFDVFIRYLEETIEVLHYSVDQRLGIKYLIEIDFDEDIYTDRGLARISQLTDKVLEYVQYG